MVRETDSSRSAPAGETSWKALGTPPNQPSRGSQAQSPRLTYPQPRGQPRLKNVLNLKTIRSQNPGFMAPPLGAQRLEVGWDLSFSPRPGGGRVLQAMDRTLKGQLQSEYPINLRPESQSYLRDLSFPKLNLRGLCIKRAYLTFQLFPVFHSSLQSTFPVLFSILGDE